MGWRFRHVFSAGLMRFTLSRAGVGSSFGLPGLRYGISATGRHYISLGFPGLGLYWMKYLATTPSSHQPTPLSTLPPVGSVVTLPSSPMPVSSSTVAPSAAAPTVAAPRA